MRLLIGLMTISLAGAAWVDSPRYGQRYVRGFQMADGALRTTRCVPCEGRRSQFTNSLDYRGNGADNLGYDWSPKAWGGPAFPAKSTLKDREPDEAWGSRGGRRMPGSWENDCRECGSPQPGRDWDRFTERPNMDDRRGRPDGWTPNTDRPKNWKGSSEPSQEIVTVTSPVLGVRLPNDKRLPVEWAGDSRSMRWDGFRNGMPWGRPGSSQDDEHMDRRSDEFHSWDATGRDVVNWDRKGHYASDWSYGSRDPAGSGSKWNEGRPWAQSWDRNQPSKDGGYGQTAGNPLFGSSYPNSDRFPSSSKQPSYSTNSWHSSTSSPKPFYNYPTSSHFQPQYPPEPRPGYPVTSRPNNYQTTGSQYPQHGSWSTTHDPYDSRPGQWTTPRPNQSYLPQSSRPPTRPGYESNGPSKPYDGTPGTAIWNGRPGSYDSRPGQSARPPHGYYTGFITEINDPNFSSGNRYPGTGSPHNQDRYPSPGDLHNQNRYPSTGSPQNQDRYPSPGDLHNPNRYPVSGGPFNQDRFPSPGSQHNQDRYPSFGNPNNQDRYPNNRFPDSYDRNTPSISRPGYSDNRFPSKSDRYPTGTNYRPPNGNIIPNYDSDRDQRPGYGPDINRYPSSSDHVNSNNNYDRNPYPNNDRNQYGGNRDQDRYPNYGNSDRYPNSSGDRDRYPTNGDVGDTHRYPSQGGGRYPNQGGGRYPSQGGGDRDHNRYPGYGNDRDRYPSRPGTSDHDRGPNPSSDSGTWNYGDDDHKDGTYRRSGGSYPPYKGGQYFTSSYLASASTPSASSQELENKNGGTTEETTAPSLE